MNMDKSPPLTPSQDAVVPILISDNADAEQNSQAALLFSFTQSSSPQQSVRDTSHPSPPPPITHTHMQRYRDEDKDMKVYRPNQ